MIKIPKTLVIDGEQWEINVISPNGLAQAIDARTNWGDYTITIDGDMSIDRQWSALIHELIHVVSGLRALDIKEKVVHSLSNGLFGIFIDNGFDFGKLKKEAINAKSNS